MTYSKTNWVDDVTPFSAGNMNKIEQGIYDAGIGLASYLAFCGNVNASMLDAAFGKNNESILCGIGMQLAMYAWFKGDSKVTYPFTNLKIKETFADCLANNAALLEITNNTNVLALVNASPYAKALYDTAYSNYMVNVVNTTSDFSAVWPSTVALTPYLSYPAVTNALCQRYPALTYLHANAATFNAQLAASTNFKTSANTYAQQGVVAQSATPTLITAKKAFLLTVYWSATSSANRPFSARYDYAGGTFTQASMFGGDTVQVNKMFNNIDIWTAGGVYGGNYTVRYVKCEA